MKHSRETEALLQEKSAAGPEPMQLDCPKCQLKHIDTLDAATGIDWATRPHKTHLCLGCGHLWKPRERATVGVAGPEPMLEGRHIDEIEAHLAGLPRAWIDAAMRHFGLAIVPVAEVVSAEERAVLEACAAAALNDDDPDADPLEPHEQGEDCYLYTDDQYAIAKAELARRAAKGGKTHG